MPSGVLFLVVELFSFPCSNIPPLSLSENQAFLGLPATVHYLTFLCRALFPTAVFDWVNDFIGVNSSYVNTTVTPWPNLPSFFPLLFVVVVAWMSSRDATKATSYKSGKGKSSVKTRRNRDYVTVDIDYLFCLRREL